MRGRKILYLREKERERERERMRERDLIKVGCIRSR